MFSQKQHATTTAKDKPKAVRKRDRRGRPHVDDPSFDDSLDDPIRLNNTYDMLAIERSAMTAVDFLGRFPPNSGQQRERPNFAESGLNVVELGPTAVESGRSWLKGNQLLDYFDRLRVDFGRY